MNDAAYKFKELGEGQQEATKEQLNNFDELPEFKLLPSEIGGFKVNQWRPPVYPTNDELCNGDTYFCEFCEVKHEDLVNDKIVSSTNFFSTSKKSSYIRHLKTKKHRDNVMKIAETDEDTINCVVCNTKFIKGSKAHHHHKQINKDWRNHYARCYNHKIPNTYDGCRCNNFVLGKRRFDSFAKLREFEDLQKDYIVEIKKNKKKIRAIKENKSGNIRRKVDKKTKARMPILKEDEIKLLKIYDDLKKNS